MFAPVRVILFLGSVEAVLRLEFFGSWGCLEFIDDDCSIRGFEDVVNGLVECYNTSILFADSVDFK